MADTAVRVVVGIAAAAVGMSAGSCSVGPYVVTVRSSSPMLMADRTGVRAVGAIQ